MPGSWYPEKGCRPDRQENPVLSEADAASACQPRGQLPVDQEVACLLAASQLVMFHNLWETSRNKEFCKQSRRNCPFLGVTPTGFLFNASLGPFVGFILFISIGLNLHFMSDFFMGLWKTSSYEICIRSSIPGNSVFSSIKWEYSFTYLLHSHQLAEIIKWDVDIMSFYLYNKIQDANFSLNFR